MQAGEGTRRGFTLVEAVVGLAVAGVMIAALVPMLLTAQRDAVVTEERLAATLTAHAVAERLRGQLVSNPALFRTLPRDASGAWRLDSAALIAQLGPGCPADLVARFAEQEIAVTIVDDVDPEPATNQPALAALCKRATITVARSERQRNAGPAAQLTVRLVVPPQSLDDDVLSAVYDNHRERWAADALRDPVLRELRMQNDPLFTQGSPLRADYQTLLADVHALAELGSHGLWANGMLEENGAEWGEMWHAYQLPEPGFVPRDLSQVHSQATWASKLARAGTPGLRAAALEAASRALDLYLTLGLEASALATDFDARLTTFMSEQGPALDELIAKLQPIADAAAKIRKAPPETGMNDPGYPALAAQVNALTAGQDLAPGGRLHEALLVAWALGNETHAVWRTRDAFWMIGNYWVYMREYATYIDGFLTSLAGDAASDGFARAEAARAMMDNDDRQCVIDSISYYSWANIRQATQAMGSADPDLARFLGRFSFYGYRDVCRARHAGYAEDLFDVKALRPDDPSSTRSNFAPGRPHPLYQLWNEIYYGKLRKVNQLWMIIVCGPDYDPSRW